MAKTKKDTQQPALVIGAVGLGQAGGNMAAEWARMGYPAVALNTARIDLDALDRRDADALGAKARLHLSAADTEGAGKDPALGEAAIRDHADAICALASDQLKDADVLLLLGGLGGGTGSALATLVDILAPLDKPMLALGTLPTRAESGIVQVNAVRAAGALIASDVDARVFADNDRLLAQSAGDPVEFYRAANTAILAPLNAFNRLNAGADRWAIRAFDPEDLRRVLLSGSVLSVHTAPLGKAIEPDALVDAVRAAVDGGTVYASGTALDQVAYLALVIEGPEDMLRAVSMQSVNDALAALKDATGGGAVHDGLYVVPTAEELSVRVLAATVEVPGRVRELVAEAREEGRRLAAKVKQTLAPLDMGDLGDLDLFRAPARRGATSPKAEPSRTTGSEAAPSDTAGVDMANAAAASADPARADEAPAVEDVGDVADSGEIHLDDLGNAAQVGIGVAAIEPEADAEEADPVEPASDSVEPASDPVEPTSEPEASADADADLSVDDADDVDSVPDAAPIGESQDSSVDGSAEGSSVDGSAEGSSVDGSAEDSSVDGSAEDSSVDGSAEGSSVDGSAEGSSVEGSEEQALDAAEPEPHVLDAPLDEDFDALVPAPDDADEGPAAADDDVAPPDELDRSMDFGEMTLTEPLPSALSPVSFPDDEPLLSLHADDVEDMPPPSVEAPLSDADADDEPALELTAEIERGMLELDAPPDAVDAADDARAAAAPEADAEPAVERTYVLPASELPRGSVEVTVSAPHGPSGAVEPGEEPTAMQELQNDMASGLSVVDESDPQMQHMYDDLVERFRQARDRRARERVARRLIEDARSEDDEVRGLAVWAMVTLAERGFRRALGRAKRDPHPEIASLAEEGLRRLSAS